MLTQFLLLGGDPDGAAVEMADPQDLTADNGQGTGPEGVTLGSEDRGFDDVGSGFEASVGLQFHETAKIVGLQSVVRFDESQLPGVSGEFDRTDGGGSRPAVGSGNDDLVGVGFGDTRRDGADAGGGDQLHGDFGIGVDLLQIEDQLRQILDGVDVVMRRR